MRGKREFWGLARDFQGIAERGFPRRVHPGELSPPVGAGTLRRVGARGRGSSRLRLLLLPTLKRREASLHLPPAFLPHPVPEFYHRGKRSPDHVAVPHQTSRQAFVTAGQRLQRCPVRLLRRAQIAAKAARPRVPASGGGSGGSFGIGTA